jgi:uncharacterized repeat protein (TIGR01451 family)
MLDQLLGNDLASVLVDELGVPLVVTDKADYAPGETATITASGFMLGAAIEFGIADDPNDPGNDGDADIYQPFSVTDGGAGDLDGMVNGQVVTTWFVPTDNNDTGSGIPDALNATLNLTATSTSGQTAATAFTDSSGSYTIKWYAADPTINSAPFLPTYQKLTPSEYIALFGAYPTGSATDPLPNAEAYASPAIASNLDAVTSLAPSSLELGQIVPFFIEIVVNGSTAPENGIITITPEWLTKTTSGGNFGFDPTYGVLAAFVDKGDPQYTDTGTVATVTGSNTTILGTGTNNERIHSDITVSGLNDGDKVIVEAWVVLKNSIPSGVTGNVQTNIFGAKTASGSTISAGNQTVPLLRVGEFFSSNADLSVIKSDGSDAATNLANLTANPDVDPTNLKPGDIFTYTILAKNNSTNTVANTVVVTDTLDLNVEFVSASNSGTFADNAAAADTVTWSIGALSPGQEQILTITVKVKDTAPTSSTTQDLLNSVRITSITSDPNTANNTNAEPTNIVAFSPNLSITKAAVITPIDTDGKIDSPTDDILYTVTVSNTGNQTLTNVVVTDPLAVTTLNPTGQIGTIASFAVGASQNFTFTYDVMQTDIDNNGGGDGDVDNIATATSTQTGLVTASTETPILQNPVLTITKAAVITPIDTDGKIDSPTDDILYSVTVSNTGNQTLTNVVVTDPLAITATNPTGQIGTIASFAVGASQNFTFTYDVMQTDIDNNGGGDGDVDNTATADSDETNPVTASTETPILQAPALTIAKAAVITPSDADGKIDSPADDILYTVTVSNTGNQTLTNVVVTDPLAITATNPTGQIGTIASFAVGASQNFTFTYDVMQTDIDNNGGGDGDVDNTATADSDETNPVTASTETPILQAPALTIAKAAVITPSDADGKIDSPADDILYTVTVSNTGNQTLTNVVVTDPLAITTTNPTGQIGTIASFAAGTSQNFTFTYDVTQTDIDNNGAGDGDVDNIATATSTQTGLVTASTETPILQSPAIDIEKLVSIDGGLTFVDADTAQGPTLNQGTDPIFKFIVTNTGNVTLSNITVSDSDFDLNGAASGTSISIATLAANNNAVGGPDESSFTFTAPWQAGQHTNTATASTTFNGAIVRDSDDANYFGQTPPAGPGVRTPGFWINTTWQKFWDGIQGNEPSQKSQPNFPKSDLLFAPYTNTADPNQGKVLDPVTATYKTGILVGDFNRDGITNAGENTLFYTTGQAIQILNASNKELQDARYILDRSLVASWLNYLAGNPIETTAVGDQDTKYYIKEAIDWLQAVTPDQNGDKKGDGFLSGLSAISEPLGAAPNSPAIAAKSSYWSTGISSPPPSPYSSNTGVSYGVDAGSIIHTALDNYNNLGTGATGAFYGG